MKKNSQLKYLLLITSVFLVACQNSLTSDSANIVDDNAKETLIDNEKVESKEGSEKIVTLDNQQQTSEDEEITNVEFQFTVIYDGLLESYEIESESLTASSDETVFDALSKYYDLQLDDGYLSIVDLNLYGNSPDASVWHLLIDNVSVDINSLEEIKIGDGLNIVMMYEEIPPAAEEYVEEHNSPQNSYGIREVPIYEGIANFTPDMVNPIIATIRVYTTPLGDTVSTQIGGTFTIDYGTTILEALNSAYGIGAENGRITEIGGIKASDLGYEEFYSEWSTVHTVKEVNMSGYVIQPDDSIAIYKR